MSGWLSSAAYTVFALATAPASPTTTEPPAAASPAATIQTGSAPASPTPSATTPPPSDNAASSSPSSTATTPQAGTPSLDGGGAVTSSNPVDADAAGADEATPQTEDVESGDEPAAAQLSGTTDFDPDASAPERKFMLGIEAVAMQLPPLRPRVVEIDPRTVGNTATLGGVGGFFRFRPTDIVGLDMTVRSGSLRYVDGRSDSQNVISQDLILADVGTVLYLARGEMGSVGIDAGVGGLFHRISYSIGDLDTSTQRYGSFVTRLGFDVELVTRRVAFIFNLRSLGVITPQGPSRNHGPAFEDASEAEQKPTTSRFQTHVVAGAGVAYRF